MNYNAFSVDNYSKWLSLTFRKAPPFIITNKKPVNPKLNRVYRLFNIFSNFVSLEKRDIKTHFISLVEPFNYTVFLRI